MAFKEFRALKTYIGTYRVLAHYDESIGDFPRDPETEAIDESFDDLYIKCKKGEIRHTYKRNKDDMILCWYTDSSQQGRNVYEKIHEKYPEIWIEEDPELKGMAYDYIIYFYSKDIEKIGDIVGISDYGAKIQVFSNKNLPKVPYEIPEKDLKKLNKIVDKMDKVQKMQFLRSAFSEFDEVIKKTKGKRYDVSAERKKSKLKPKYFIHSIGMWDEFIEFCKSKSNV